MYIKTRRGVFPSKEMVQFLSVSKVELLKQLPYDATPPDSTKPHRLTLGFFLPTLYNAGYPKTTTTRFKRRDTSNLVKVVEDLVARVLGIDDSCFVEGGQAKHHGPDHHGFVGVSIMLEEIPEP